MFDTVNFWINRVDISSGNPFEILPFLSDVTERQSEKGYDCIGSLINYTVYVSESGISLKGSLAKNHFGDNIHTLTRKDTQRAIEELSDRLHIDVNLAKVTRLDVSTILYTKRQPSDYYRYLGQKPYFKRLDAVKDETLYYLNHQRQIIFYDKKREAIKKGVQIPEILQNANLLRYELRYMKGINRQLNDDVKAGKLYTRPFYDDVIRNWGDEFKTIQKLKKQSIMMDDITTVKDAEMALFAFALNQLGQSTIDEFLDDLKAANKFSDRQRYYELKKRLQTIASTYEFHEKNELMQEIESQAFNIARYAR